MNWICCVHNLKILFFFKSSALSSDVFFPYRIGRPEDEKSRKMKIHLSHIEMSTLNEFNAHTQTLLLREIHLIFTFHWNFVSVLFTIFLFRWEKTFEVPAICAVFEYFSLNILSIKQRLTLFKIFLSFTQITFTLKCHRSPFFPFFF